MKQNTILGTKPASWSNSWSDSLYKLGWVQYFVRVPWDCRTIFMKIRKCQINRKVFKKAFCFFFWHFLIFQFYFYLLSFLFLAFQTFFKFYYFLFVLSCFLFLSWSISWFLYLLLLLLMFSLKSLSQSQEVGKKEYNITKNKLIGIIQTRIAS